MCLATTVTLHEVLCEMSNAVVRPDTPALSLVSMQLKSECIVNRTLK